MLTPDLESRSASTCHSPQTNLVDSVAEPIHAREEAGGGL
jgi:hypothetical protein